MIERTVETPRVFHALPSSHDPGAPLYRRLMLRETPEFGQFGRRDRLTVYAPSCGHVDECGYNTGK